MLEYSSRLRYAPLEAFRDDCVALSLALKSLLQVLYLTMRRLISKSGSMLGAKLTPS